MHATERTARQRSCLPRTTTISGERNWWAEKVFLWLGAIESQERAYEGCASLSPGCGGWQQEEMEFDLEIFSDCADSGDCG